MPTVPTGRYTLLSSKAKQPVEIDAGKSLEDQVVTM